MCGSLLRSLPLHVTPLRPTECQDAILGEDVQRKGIDTLLVDDDEVLGLLTRPYSLVADEVLQLDDLLALRVSEASLRLDELLALLGRRVEETRVDLARPMSTAC